MENVGEDINLFREMGRYVWNENYINSTGEI